MANVQAASRLLLARGRSRPLQGRRPLGAADAPRAALYHHGPRLFRVERRHRARKPGPAVHGRRGRAGGQGLLRVPDCDGEHPLGNVQPPDRHLPRRRAKARGLQRHYGDSVRPAQGGVGASLDQRRGALPDAAGGLCHRGGPIFLGRLLQRVLAQDAGRHAGPHFQQRAHQPGRGHAHGLCEFNVQALRSVEGG